MILIIANYRTGSTTLVKRLCEIHGYSHTKYSGELFHGHKYTSGHNSDSVVKVMPDQIPPDHYTDFCADYCETAEQIYYCVRKDFDAQVRSYCIASTLGEWHPQTIEAQNHIRHSSAPGLNKMKIRLEHNPVVEKLHHNLKSQAQLYKQYPGNLVWLENRIQQPYARDPYTEPPIIDDGYSHGVDPVSYFL